MPTFRRVQVLQNYDYVNRFTRCFNLTVFAIFFFCVGCGKMTAWQFGKTSALEAAWPEGPGTVPTNPGNLDSGILTPFSNLEPEREVWVATYGSDTAAGTLFEPKRTIGAAILVATPGTSIMVKAGVYRENLSFSGTNGTMTKPIWLRSADGKGKAEMAALLAGAEAINLAGTNAVLVEGFKITGGVVLESSGAKATTNIVIQNNLITNGLVDGITTDYGSNFYIIANEISASPRGQGIQMHATKNVLIADNYIHDLRTSGTKNDGINLKGDMQAVMIQNNIIERIDGSGLVLEGINVVARANSVKATRRAATFSGCTSCSLERNNIFKAAGGLLSDVGLAVGDSPLHATTNIKLMKNCIYRSDWLYTEPGTTGGLVNQTNTANACL